MSSTQICPDELRRALSLRDLTDPSQGPHAMQLLIDAVVKSLTDAWHCEAVVNRASPVASVEDNYDRLRYPPDGAARYPRYTRYCDDGMLLRTQTSAMIPPLLRSLAADQPENVLLVCPGLVYRRDVIDRLHTGEPHQVDLWRIRRGTTLGVPDLLLMIDLVGEALLPGASRRYIASEHPYTLHGLQVDAQVKGRWVEIGECGLAHPEVVADAGLPASSSGIAMGLGLDRILMMRKGIDDIRLLRSDDERVASQMLDLEPYRPVSTRPPIRRDLSIAVREDATAEEIGDRVRSALDAGARSLEAVEILSETPRDRLLPAAIARIGLQPGQKNVLIRLTIRDLQRTLTDEEANAIRDEVYAALHEGSVHQWASGPR